MTAKLPSEFIDVLNDIRRALASLEKAEALSRDLKKRLATELESIDARLNDVIDHLTGRA